MKRIRVHLLLVTYLVLGIGLAFADTQRNYTVKKGDPLADTQKVYVVKRGDTLVDVLFTLQKVEGVEIDKIFVWNPDLGTQIQTGQQIVYYIKTEPKSYKLSEEEINSLVTKALAESKNNGKDLGMPAKEDEKTLLQKYPDMGYYFVLVILLVFMLTFIFSWLYLTFKKNVAQSKSVDEPREELDPQTSSFTECAQHWVVINPNADQLRREGIFPRRILLFLQNNQQVHCTVNMINGKLFVYFDDEPDRPVTWEKRRTHLGKKIEAATDSSGNEFVN